IPVAKNSMDRADAEVRRLEATKQAREAFDRHEAWRPDRLAEIDDGLEHHWARTVLSAVREGDPLAYGPNRLRQARSTYAADLARMERTDRRDGRGLGHHQGATAATDHRASATTSRAELSATVAEL